MMDPSFTACSFIHPPLLPTQKSPTQWLHPQRSSLKNELVFILNSTGVGSRRGLF